MKTRISPTLLAACVSVFAATAACAGQAAPEDQRMPSPAEIARSQDLLRGTVRMPSTKEMGQAGLKLPKLPETRPGEGRVDLEAIARSYDQKLQAPAAATSAEESMPPLAVFVSLGMPEGSLKRLVQDAESARAVLVLRGLKDRSMQATKLEIQRLNGKHQVAWRIDPRMFEAFDVQAVPTTLIIDPASRTESPACGAPACSKARHSKLTGDVSIDHALRAIAQADPGLRAQAEQHLALMAKRSFQGGGRP